MALVDDLLADDLEGVETRLGGETYTSVRPYRLAFAPLALYG